MPTSRARRGRTARGFATIEVLVTVAVVVLIAGVSVMLLGRSDRLVLRSEASEVALLLQQARLRAAESGRDQIVRYDPDARSLVAASGQVKVLADGVVGPAEALAVRIRPSGESEGLVLPLSAGDAARVVRLDWLTGRVEVAP